MTESFRTSMGWFDEVAIEPFVSATYPLERAIEALDQVVSRNSTGKVVIKTTPVA
jgi:NADPH:quinone reductase-like Zn-dependent oxidoreductase